ncbi:MAG TPA: hypothetical protein VJ802_14815 [Gemmatimonadaceae bacterium]|nr:hypothetical protein [Gemmatimonadaceae bacterium]
MAERGSGARLASVLWFVAAVLALAAAGIRYYRREEISWTWVAAGVFCLVMGLGAWKRARLGGGEPGSPSA